jgi:hypothetical protein
MKGNEALANLFHVFNSTASHWNLAYSKVVNVTTPCLSISHQVTHLLFTRTKKSEDNNKKGHYYIGSFNHPRIKMKFCIIYYGYWFISTKFMLHLLVHFFKQCLIFNIIFNDTSNGAKWIVFNKSGHTKSKVMKRQFKIVIFPISMNNFYEDSNMGFKVNPRLVNWVR